MAEPRPKQTAGREQGDALERALLEYVRDPGLWPVLTVLVLVAATLGATTLLFALRAHSPVAMVALLALILPSVAGLGSAWRARRFGPGARLLVGLWVASLAIAGGLVALGAF